MNKKVLLSNDIVCLLILVFLPFLFYFNWFSHFNDALWTYGDGEYSYFSYRKFMLENWKSGIFPFWNHYINLGFPFSADPQTETLYPMNLLYLILPFNESFNLLMIIHFALAGVFTFIFLRSLKLSPFTCLLGAIAFMFCGSINTRRGHVSVEYTLIWLPLIFYSYQKVKETHSYRFISLLSIACAMQFYAGFTQASFYSLLVLGLYMIYSITEYKKKSVWIKEVTIFSLLFLGLILVQLIPTLKTAISVGREHLPYDIFASYSLPFRNLSALINPLYMGFEYPNTPFQLFSKAYSDAENLTEFSLYAGIIPIAFAFFAIFKNPHKNKLIIFWTIVFFLSLIFSLGDNLPFFYKIMHKFPGVNSFRVPARMLFIFNFSIVILFSFAFDLISKNRTYDCILKPFFRFFLLSSFALTAYIIYSGRGTINSPELLIPIVLTLICVLFSEYGYFKLINKNLTTKAMIMVVLIMDLWFFAFFNSNIFTEVKPSSKFASVIKQIDSENKYRILTIAGVGGELSFDFLGRNRNMVNDVRSLIGHTSFIPKVFMEALRCDEAGTFYDYDYFLRNLPLIAALNTKWIILNNSDPSNERYSKVKQKLKLISKYNNFDIFEIPNSQLPIFGLKNVRYSDSNVIDTFNYIETGLVKERLLEGNYALPSEISNITIKNGSITANIKTESDSFIAISETYNNDWYAYLNNESAKIYKVNGLIMGIKVPKGIYQITLNYFPKSFYISLVFTALSIVIAILFFRSIKTIMPGIKIKELGS